MQDNLLQAFATAPDLHQNTLYAKAMSQIGWETVGDPGSYLYLRRLGPLAIAKIQHPTSLDLSWLQTMRKKYHILTTYVEPGLSQLNISKLGIKTDPFANSATSLLDLTLTQDKLLASFKPKTRYNISYAQRRNNLTIVTKDFAALTDTDLAVFKESRERWSKRKGVIGYEEKFLLALLSTFSGSGWLHFAYHNNLCVGTLMVLKNATSAIYYSAFVEPEGNKVFAPTFLTWQAIATAQEAGCTIFDFGGIYDPRYPKMYKKWQGFTKFKEGFNPTVVTYPETQLLLGW